MRYFYRTILLFAFSMVFTHSLAFKNEQESMCKRFVSITKKQIETVLANSNDEVGLEVMLLFFHELRVQIASSNVSSNREKFVEKCMSKIWVVTNENAQKTLCALNCFYNSQVLANHTFL